MEPKRFHPKFKSMVDIVPEGATCNVKIEHFEVSKADSDFTRLRAFQHPGEYVPPGKYVRLRVGGGVMMSDTPMEQDSNSDVMYRANGKVLIAGLGIGMILVPILENPDVTEVTVVEKSSEVLTLVGGRGKFPNIEKLKLVHADIFEWTLPVGARWDTIYFDIWQDICEDNLEEVTRLKRKFALRLNRDNPQAWMGAWQEENLRYERRRRARNY